MSGQVKNFVYEHALTPLIAPGEAYSIETTAIYATLFAVLTVYLAKMFIDNGRTPENEKLYFASAPWILSLGGLSALLELGTLQRSLPVLTITVILVTGLTLLNRKKKLMETERNILITGLLLFTAIISLFDFTDYSIFVSNLALITVIAVTGLLFVKSFLPSYFRIELMAPITAHYMDAVSTVVALNSGGTEQQFLARKFIEFMGLPGIFVLKSIVIIPVVLIIYRRLELEKARFYLYVITALGLGISMRNILLTASGF